MYISEHSDELEEEGIINPPEYKGKAMLLSLLKKGQVPASELTKDEKQLIDKIGNAKGYNTEAIVDFFHNQLPWQICRMVRQSHTDHYTGRTRKYMKPQTTL